MNRLRAHTFCPSAWRRVAVATALALVLVASAPAQPTVQFRQTSVPLGVVNQTATPTAGTVVSTVAAPEVSGTYTFINWTLNGVRAVDASGAAANPATFTINANTDAVAVYVPTTQDSDGDGLPDWWEYRYFGDLSQGLHDNPDGDAFDNADEYARGQSPVLANEHAHGGISRRRSPAVIVIQDTADYVRLTESSVPAGVFGQTRVVPKGVPVALSNPPSSSSGYYFTGWLLNGTRYDKPTDYQPITVVPNADTSFVARYILGSVDSDLDGIADWLEMLTFESLQYDLTSDPDGDGFTWGDEMARGFSTLANDELAQGGLSRRRSAAVYVDTTGRLPYRLTSDPATIVEQTTYQPAGTVITAPDRNGNSYANYLFAYYDLNGVRQQDASGVALTTFSFVLNAPATVTAHYVDPTVDSDGDGVKDWNEIVNYGTLAYGPTDDTDGDGFTYAQELARGFSPRVVDTLEGGGVSRRRSPAVYVDTTGRLPFQIASDPPNILSSKQYLLPGTVVTAPDENGNTYANYRFVWWDLNGVRQQDASGTALTTFIFALNTPATATAHYVDAAADTDSDGIPDYIELTYYSSLSYGQTDDTDGDGFSFKDELARGFSPRVFDYLEGGGISRRRSAAVTINPIIDAMAPVIGTTGVSNIGGDEALLNAMVNAMSAATAVYFEFGLTSMYGMSSPAQSLLNGFAAVNMLAQLQSLLANSLYHYRVVATNNLGTSVSPDETFQTQPVLSPFEAWRQRLHVGGAQADDDGDGVPNLVEYAFGLNPLDPSDGRLVPVPELINGRFHLHYTAPDGMAGVVYGAQWSSDLVNWTSIIDSGSGSTHDFYTPIGATGAQGLFVRWSIQSTQ